MMLYIIRKVLTSLVEFSNIDDVASCVTQQHMIFVVKRVVAKTAVDWVWQKVRKTLLISWQAKTFLHILKSFMESYGSVVCVKS